MYDAPEMQEEDSRCDFLGLAESPHGDLREKFVSFRSVTNKICGLVGRDVAGRHGVDRDPVGGPFVRHHLCHLADPALRRGVDREVPVSSRG